MTRESILAVFARRQAAWDARDGAALARSHGENGTVQSPMFGSRTGHAEIADSYRAVFRSFPDWTFEGDDVIVDGARVAQPFAVTATHSGEFFGLAGTGRRFRIQGVLVCEMRDDLIERERRLYDFTGLLIQVGVLRSKPGA